MQQTQSTALGWQRRKPRRGRRAGGADQDLREVIRIRDRKGDIIYREYRFQGSKCTGLVDDVSLRCSGGFGCQLRDVGAGLLQTAPGQVRVGPGRAGWGRSDGYDAGPGRAEKPRVHVRLGGFLRSAPCTGQRGVSVEVQFSNVQ